MKTIIDYGLFGFGPINQGVKRIADEHGWKLRWVSRKAGLFSSLFEKMGEPKAVFDRKHSQELDVVFLAIPSSGNGDEPSRIARHFLRRGIAVVIAEKSGLACCPSRFYRYSQSLGFSATVGGNVGVLDMVVRDPLGVVEVVGIPNTTLNFLRGKIVAGATYVQALAEARRFKFTEDGNLQAEVRDALLKGVILFNRVTGLRKPLRFGELKPKSMSDEDIRFALAMDCTCVVRVSQTSQLPVTPNRMICHCTRKGWRLEIYFENSFVLPFKVPEGDRNVFLIRNSAGGSYQPNGCGAGVKPTAGTMFVNALSLLGLN